ncbi:MAG: FG-GAP repeat protein [Myxococcales bacterium]|nr:FG-GAP repeat protein [Myxococcales bacterium]
MQGATRQAGAAGCSLLRSIFAVACLSLASSCALVGYDLLPFGSEGPSDSAADGSVEPMRDAMVPGLGDASVDSMMDASVDPMMDASVDSMIVASSIDASSMDASATDGVVPDASPGQCEDAGDCGPPGACHDASADCPAPPGCDASGSCTGMDGECAGDAGTTDGQLCSTGICRDGACEPYPPVILEHPIGPTPSGLFGDSLAFDGDRLIIGAPYDDRVQTNDGAAHVYRRVGGGNWLLETSLYGETPRDDDQFGEDVDLDGEWVVVGADHSTGEGFPSFGFVSVYRDTGGGLSSPQILPNAGDLVDQTQFGNRLAMSGNLLVITGFFDTYFYHYNGVDWSFTLASGLGKASRVDIDSGTAVLSFEVGSDGQVFVTTNSSGVWGQAREITSDDDEAGDMFGRGSVAIQGDTIAVGAHRYTGSGPPGAGAVYIFERAGNTWVQTQRLQAMQPVDSEEFGSTVALDGPRLVVGVPLADTTVPDAGAVDVFVRSAGTWVWQQRVLPSQPITGGRMSGSDLAISGRFLAFSSEEVEVSGVPQAGAVEIVLLD